MASGTELAKAYVQIVPSAEGIGSQLTSAISGEVEQSGESTGKSMGKKLAVGAVAAVAAEQIGKQISNAINEGMDFDVAMSQLAATMGTTTDQIQDLRDYAQEMGATTAFSATEAAEGLNTLAMSGLDANEQMEVLPSVMNLASAGAMELDTAASYVTGSIKGFGDSMDNAEYYADLMAKGATMANTDVNALGEAMSTSAATASNYGQEADSVTVALLRLAEQNVTGSEAATMLNRTMADLYTPTDAAKQALDELGVATYDEQGNARDLNDVVDDLDTALSGMSQEEANAYKDTIFTTNGLKGFNDMTASSTETVDKFKDGLNEASGSAAQQAATQLDNLAGDMTLFNSAVSGAQIAVSDALTPALRSIVEFGTDAISAFTEGFLEDGLSGVFSAGLDIVSSLAEGIEENLPGMLTQGVDAVMDFVGGLGTAIPQVIEAAQDVIGSLVSGIVAAIPEFVEQAPVAIANFIAGLGASLPDLLQSGWDMLLKVAEGITTAIPEIVAKIPEIISNIKAAFADTDWLEVASNILSTIGNGLLSLGSMLWDMVTSVAETAKDWFTSVDWIQTGKDLINNIIDGITEFVTSIPEKLKGIAQDAITFFTEGEGVDWLQSGKDIITNIINGITEFVTSIPDKLKEIAKSAIGFFTGKDSEDADWEGAGTGVINTIIDGITSAITFIPNKIIEIAQNAIAVFKGDSEDESVDWLQTGIDVIESIASGIAGAVTSIPSKIIEIAKNAIASFKGDDDSEGGGVIDWVQTGLDVIDSIVTGIGNAITSIPSKIAGIAKDAISAFKGDGADGEGIDWSNAGDAAITLIGGGIDLVTSIPGKLAGIAKNAISSFKGDGDDSEIDWEDAGSKVTNMIGNGISGAWESVTSAIGGVASSAWEKVTGFFGIGGEGDMEEVGEEVDQGFANGVENGGEEAADAMEEESEGVLSRVKNFFGINSPSTVMEEQGEYMTEGMVQGFDELADEVTAKFQEMADMIWKWSGEQITTMQQTGIILEHAFVTGMEDMPTDVQTDILDPTDSSITTWANTESSDMKKYAADILSMLINGISSMPEDVNSILSNVADKIKSWASTVISSVKSAASELLSGFISGISSMPNQTDSILNSVISSVNSFANNIISAANSAGVNASDGFSNGISGMAQSASSTMYDVQSAMTNIDMYNSMYNIGSNAMIGFNNGMVSQEQLIYNNANIIANNVRNTISSALQISSPSKVTEYLGEMTGKGLAVGMKNTVSDIEGTAQTMADAAKVSAVSTVSNKVYTDEIVTTTFASRQNEQDKVLEQLVNLSDMDVTTDAESAAVDEMNDKLDRLLSILTVYFPQIAQDVKDGKNMYIDGDKWVGATKRKYDRAFGQLKMAEERG